MILAEKITYLRKQKGWSQEELADRLNISRQSVSKWESGTSIPELDKIIGMSSIFDVSTDFLLKDEYDTSVISKPEEDLNESEATLPENDREDGRKTRAISLEEANTYLQTVQKTSKWIAAGVLICILSPICLIAMGGWSEYGPVAISESMAAGLGITVLLVMVAAAVAIFIVNGSKLEAWEFLETEEIQLQYGVSGIVEKQKGAYERRYRQSLALGVTVCIVSVLPVMIAMGFDVGEIWQVYSVCMLLAVVSPGVFVLVRTGSIWESYQKLLQEGDYLAEEKRSRKKMRPLAGIYWCLVVAVYLAVSLRNDSWSTSWCIWPVAALLFAAVWGIFRVIIRSRDRQ